MFPLNHEHDGLKQKEVIEEECWVTQCQGEGKAAELKGKEKQTLEAETETRVGYGAPLLLYDIVPLNLNGTFRHLPVTVEFATFSPTLPQR